MLPESTRISSSALRLCGKICLESQSYIFRFASSHFDPTFCCEGLGTSACGHAVLPRDLRCLDGAIARVRHDSSDCCHRAYGNQPHHLFDRSISSGSDGQASALARSQSEVNSINLPESVTCAVQKPAPNSGSVLHVQALWLIRASEKARMGSPSRRVPGNIGPHFAAFTQL